MSIVVSSIISFFNPPVDQWTFRRSGGTMDPNEFSTQLLMATAITIFLYEKNRNLIFLVGSLVLFLIVFVYAGSKSAMLTLALLGFYAIVVKFGSLFRKILSFKGLIALAIIGLISLQVDFGKFEAVAGMQERAAQHGTADTRFVSWEAGWRMAQDNFLLGIGLEVYEDYARGYAVDYIADGSLAPHNVFVKLIAEVGIFAFVGFLVFLYYLFTTKYLQIRQSSYFWISLVAYSNILMGLTLSSTYDKTFWISLGLLSNVIIILYKEQNEVKNENTPHII
jgi:O-antigen ligase